MKIVFMGTGTSIGIPVPGCECNVCKSDNPKNKRNRPSLMIIHNNCNIIIDTPQEFRIQLIRENVKNIEAILYTHHHADHLLGLDDIRYYNVKYKRSIPIYANKETIKHIKTVFSYIFSPVQIGGGVPQIEINEVKGKFSVCGIDFEPLKVMHGKLSILGYKWGKMAYITDASLLPEETIDAIMNLDILIINALKYKKHPTHFNVEEALDIIEKVKPKKAYLTHLSHDLEHEKLQSELPANVFVAWDGLSLKI